MGIKCKYMDKSSLIPEKNEKGEYALYENGKFTRYAPVTTIHGAIILLEMKPKLLPLIEQSIKDNCPVTVSVGLRTFLKQYVVRKSYVIDKTKKEDEYYLLNQPSWQYVKGVYTPYFYPLAAKPGFSKHQNGTAIDFNLTGKPIQYKWMIENAIKFGFIRTIPSEIWHWEFFENEKNMYKYVLKEDKSWKIL